MRSTPGGKGKELARGSGVAEQHHLWPLASRETYSRCRPEYFPQPAILRQRFPNVLPCLLSSGPATARFPSRPWSANATLWVLRQFRINRIWFDIFQADNWCQTVVGLPSSVASWVAVRSLGSRGTTRPCVGRSQPVRWLSCNGDTACRPACRRTVGRRRRFVQRTYRPRRCLGW